MTKIKNKKSKSKDPAKQPNEPIEIGLKVKKKKAKEGTEMSTVNEASKLRKELKERGYSNRRVSVNHSYCGYSSSITVTIKDLSIPLATINDIACTYKSVRYCEITQEVLQGANTYVDVKYDYELLENATEEKLEQAEKIVKGLENKEENYGDILFETSEVNIYLYKSARYDRSIASIHFENKDGSYNEKKGIYCFNTYDVARFLVLYENQIKESEVVA